MKIKLTRKRILFIFGTRPEAIKMAPLIKEFQKCNNFFWTKVCVTGQHQEMLDQMLDFFRIEPDYDLNLMTYNQTQSQLASKQLLELEKILSNWLPDLILVQGDTLTTLFGSLAGFYKRIKIAHIEAGLRSNNKYSPYPEEINRVLVDHIADYFFVPTDKCRTNLLKEGIKDNIFLVGNTVIDALFFTLENINKNGSRKYFDYFRQIDFSKKIILVTGHRRESFGQPLKNICSALKKIADTNENVAIVYPIHLNPNVYRPVKDILGKTKNIVLFEPLDYPKLVWLLNKSYLILTDSGGIQEEAPSLGKPVLITREVTERIEGIQAGTAKLVGTDFNKIIQNVNLLLTNKQVYNKMAKAKNPYGDGKSSPRIVKKIKEIFPISS
ncbi:UDP-N-acetylglucosamine 2-epimerase [Candidatus Daviesbacteria bacterium RIFCSPLOWO2_02_FULL_41_8]|uniref:UDP-N-acetylglucosamine 2-epimerase (non-hydrolyzing) n=3 Tax=Candidatus Daviesiibacteriota TaxID=1752718 RepID=A0A1F5NHL7_9BACT|nr:MAG: UDP-N-acetylglucosamine 2-epimerase [Candidatus Daviesbacteria bacterium RIFCSPHIGHO2_01_FULL_41_23]OGE32968.1 MAG: UDP-N-acetylglucosamine 2-epimerase [Candidatus Daviesbacteria bacterium RIFCSPHIGHO2_02_FULL_41_10]OGE62452.1 MAG: UDP-N-acetylglucosamine 2-epimerase [Candidatus Daviesbacteria bacterium RIFCSPLOWO2_01_FULL_41_32]OGE77201.1 MAG: UDP-N-acetylglucosamine 2-epimerase [Candidatus Daviesbacteria bacterium RIFCSPLOWO2_02_FULL_41_8]